VKYSIYSILTSISERFDQLSLLIFLMYLDFYTVLLVLIHSCESGNLEEYDTIRYDTIEEFNVDSKAENSALSRLRALRACIVHIVYENALLFSFEY